MITAGIKEEGLQAQNFGDSTLTEAPDNTHIVHFLCQAEISRTAQKYPSTSAQYVALRVQGGVSVSRVALRPIR